MSLFFILKAGSFTLQLNVACSNGYCNHIHHLAAVYDLLDNGRVQLFATAHWGLQGWDQFVENSVIRAAVNPGEEEEGVCVCGGGDMVVKLELHNIHWVTEP